MIFLYRGELHKVSGVTRQWPLPKPSISLSAFRQALEKRNDAVRRSSSSVPTPYLTRQDTCVSGSHNVSPAQLRSREDPETDIGREGRGESDGHANMDEDAHLEAADVGDRSCRSFGEEYRDGNAPMDDSAIVRAQSFDDHEPKQEVEDHLEKKERKKRKREEAIEVSKGKVKVEVKLEDEMELDHKVEAVENSTRAPSVEKDEADLMAMDEGLEAKLPQGDFVKVEAPSTPPVHSEEMNTLQPVEGKDHVEEANATGDKEVVKAELEAKLKKLTAEKHRLVQMLKQVQSTEKESKKKVQSASQSPSALGLSPPAPLGPSSVTISTDVVPTAAPDTTATEVLQKGVEAPLLVRPNRFGRQNNSSRHTVQVLSTEEESKKKVASQSPPAPGTQSVAEVPPEAGAVEVQPSADLEEGELEYARTPSPPSTHTTTTTTTSHAASHGQHSHGSTPALGPLLGRQPPHLNQGGSARGSYYQQGMSLPSPSSAAAAAALVGAISPGTGFMPLALGGRPFQQHMVMQHAAAMQAHAQKVAAAAGHSHMSPILGGGGPAGAGNGVNNGPPGFGGYGVSPSVHGHHGHMSQGSSPGAGHIGAQQGVASPSLLTTPRGAGYHGMNTPWNMQR